MAAPRGWCRGKGHLGNNDLPLLHRNAGRAFFNEAFPSAAQRLSPCQTRLIRIKATISPQKPNRGVALGRLSFPFSATPKRHKGPVNSTMQTGLLTSGSAVSAPRSTGTLSTRSFRLSALFRQNRRQLVAHFRASLRRSCRPRQRAGKPATRWLCWQSAANTSLPANLGNAGSLRQTAGVTSVPCKSLIISTCWIILSLASQAGKH